jgi:hypothetical protein
MMAGQVEHAGQVCMHSDLCQRLHALQVQKVFPQHSDTGKYIVTGFSGCWTSPALLGAHTGYGMMHALTVCNACMTIPA